ncbi:MAG: DoxX family protein [Hyphomicrobiales bacterium]
MDSINAALEAWAPRVLSILRIFVALFFLQHGLAKYFGFPMALSSPLTPLLYVAGAIEIIGGLLLALGLFTRPAAFIMSGEMAVAYFMARPAISFFPLVNRGELEALFSFVFFYFVFAGGGAWSLDRVLLKRD